MRLLGFWVRNASSCSVKRSTVASSSRTRASRPLAPGAVTCCALPPGRLEVLESLEQLRWLEAGHSMRCLAVDRVSPGIDTQAQFEAFRSSIEDVPKA